MCSRSMHEDEKTTRVVLPGVGAAVLLPALGCHMYRIHERRRLLAALPVPSEFAIEIPRLAFLGWKIFDREHYASQH